MQLGRGDLRPGGGLQRAADLCNAGPKGGWLSHIEGGSGRSPGTTLAWDRDVASARARSNAALKPTAGCSTPSRARTKALMARARKIEARLRREREILASGAGDGRFCAVPGASGRCSGPGDCKAWRRRALMAPAAESPSEKAWMT